MPRAQDIPDTPYLIESAHDITGGVIDFGEEHLLPPNAAAYLLNVETTFAGRRKRSDGQLPRAPLGTQGGTGEPTGLGAFEGLAFNHIVATRGNHLYSFAGGDYTFTHRASGVSLLPTDQLLTQGRGAGNTPTLFLSSAAPYSANASLPFQKLVCVANDWTYTTASVSPRATLWHQSRLWTLNDPIAGRSALAWSNVLDGQDFAHGNNVLIDPSTGDEGTALIGLRGSTPQLLIFKERSIHRLDIYWETDGFYPASANALDYTSAKLTPIVTKTGCVATRGLTWVPGLQGADLLFLSREGIRSLSRSATDAQGGAGLPLSAKIQAQIDRINWAHADRSLATTWDNIAYFAVPVDGAVRPNFIIAHNLLRGSWFFHDWNTAGWTPAKVDSARKFFFLSNQQYSDGVSTPSLSYHLYETNNGTAAPGGSPIIFEEQTRAFVFPTEDGDPISGLRHQKRWRQLVLKLQSAATTASLAIQYRVDDSTTWKTLDTLFIDPNDSYPRLAEELPFTFDSDRIIQRTLSLRKIPPGYRLQFRFRDDSSFAALQILNVEVYAHRRALKFEDRV